MTKTIAIFIVEREGGSFVQVEITLEQYYRFRLENPYHWCAIELRCLSSDTHIALWDFVIADMNKHIVPYVYVSPIRWRRRFW